MLKLVHICIRESFSFYTEAKIMDNEDVNRVYEYVRKNRKRLSIKAHTDNPVFVNEERVYINGLVLLAEEEDIGTLKSQIWLWCSSSSS